VEEVPPTARIIFIEFRKRVFGFIVDQVFDVVEASQVLDLEKVFLKLT
jgi:chemotaxis signal transduction protein